MRTVQDYYLYPIPSVYPEWEVWDVRDKFGHWVCQFRLNHVIRRYWRLMEPGVDAHSVRSLEGYDQVAQWIKARLPVTRL